MKKSILKKYAELVVKTGVNVQKGQEVNLTIATEHSEFAFYISEWCYKVGAKRVNIEWYNDDIDRLNNKKQTLKTMKDMPNWKIEKIKNMSEVLPCRIFVESSDPDVLKGLDQNKLAEARKTNFPKYKKYIDEMDNKYQWTIVAAPSKKWAKKVFPELSVNNAYNKLWDAILYTTRITDNPIESWENHNKYLKEQCKKLNDYDFKYLHFTSSNGTDLKVGLMDGQQFASGSETSLQNITFNPNMPSEECFGMPSKYEVDGIVYSTKPLSYNGELIEDFNIRFEKGKAIEVHAKKGEELLKKMISMDEGAAYLGEVALVPYDSPISNSNILFYNTLFDENASCHLALGKAYTCNIKGYERMSQEDFEKLGINDSMNHVDFMIGSKDTTIKGYTRDGKTVDVFKNGNWAI